MHSYVYESTLSTARKYTKNKKNSKRRVVYIFGETYFQIQHFARIKERFNSKKNALFAKDYSFSRRITWRANILSKVDNFCGDTKAQTQI